eukprot:scaffold24899_cov113-Cylindrotheca_fusiformis.AAC.1
MTYEEWQSSNTSATTGRVSTVLFHAVKDENDNESLQWLHVHETWLPPNESNSVQINQGRSLIDMRDSHWHIPCCLHEGKLWNQNSKGLPPLAEIVCEMGTINKNANKAAIYKTQKVKATRKGNGQGARQLCTRDF